MRKVNVFICLIVIGAFFTYGCKQQDKIDTVDTDYIQYHNFSLIKKGNQYFIHVLKDHPLRRIPIPTHWLTEPSENENILHSYISTTDFSQTIASFKISDNAIGLYVSSYSVLQGGSAAAAGGRDVFLVYEPSKQKISPGKIDLGISKSRIRDSSKFYATCHKFMISDYNHDGFEDIGVTKEEITYQGFNRVYIMHPSQWYLFKKDHWEYDPRLDSFIPWQDYFELPYFDIVKSPVDYVKDLSNLKYRGK